MKVSASSLRKGAAQVDDVTNQIGSNSQVGTGWGDYETTSAIDKKPSVTAVNARKSTGKAPEKRGGRPPRGRPGRSSPDGASPLDSAALREVIPP